MVEVRAGAVDRRPQTLVGIDTPTPIPSGRSGEDPVIALYRDRVRQGVAKIAAFGYTSDGKLIDIADPQLGYSHQYERTVLFFFTWRSSDLPQEKTNALDLQ